jgi:hypothetical protein
MPRLAFIRYLYNLAVDQSRLPEPMSRVAVLMFHDSVEMFLQLAAQHVNAPTTTDTKFNAYWKLINDSLPTGTTPLGHTAGMVRLNRARVDFKHLFLHIARTEIDGFRTTVTAFFEESVPNLFGIDFGAISMVDLVECSEAQQSLRHAERHLEAGDTTSALGQIAIAFNQVLDQHITHEKTHVGEYSEEWWAEHYWRRGSSWLRPSPALRNDQHLRDFVDGATKMINALRSKVDVLAIGLDYGSYNRYQRFSPPVMRRWDETDKPTYTVSDIPAISVEDCRFCFDFVIDSAIRIQQFDSRIQS